jgi:hypothetical protein
MVPKKILVKEGNIAIVTCPLCQKIKKLSVGKYKEKGKRNLKIRCNCETIFEVLLEFRRYPRTSSKLIGHSVNLSKHRESQKILIKNISVGGIGFSPFRDHRTESHDQLMVSFNLNDAAHTYIDSQVTVRAAKENYIGCEFNSNERFIKDLGFYLIS